jgi:DNA-binding LytR/AlgR family response regulator
MKALIIEDEILAARHLKQILDKRGNIEVVGTLETIAEAVEWFGKGKQTDLVFLDIHLADGNAFEIFNQVRISAPIIFTTAYDEYALKAFKVNSIDYLLKPIDSSDIDVALEKLNTLSSPGNMQQMISGMLDYFRNEQKFKTLFLVPVKGDKLHPVRVADIAYLFIDSGIVKAVSFDNKTFRLDHTLDEIENMINPDKFFRANRQFIISRESIKDIDLWFNSKLSVNLKNDPSGKIVISKARAGEFKKWFSGEEKD